MATRRYIRTNEPVSFRNAITVCDTWFEMWGKSQRFFKQRRGGKKLTITDDGEKKSLIWFYERYRADGSRV